MLFYDCSTAPSPRRARMFIAEKGLEIESREISMLKGEQMSPEFLAINPRATIPVLVTDDGTVLTENLAIAAYLEELHPEIPLMGSTAEERALVLMWNTICETQGGHAIADALAAHPVTEDTSIVIVTRNVEQDVAAVPLLLETPARYIGVMGSERRWSEASQQLGEAGITAEQLERIHAPIGIEIHAETLEEIAVSILAEVIGVTRAEPD